MRHYTCWSDFAQTGFEPYCLRPISPGLAGGAVWQRSNYLLYIMLIVMFLPKFGHQSTLIFFLFLKNGH